MGDGIRGIVKSVPGAALIATTYLVSDARAESASSPDTAIAQVQASGDGAATATYRLQLKLDRDGEASTDDLRASNGSVWTNRASIDAMSVAGAVRLQLKGTMTDLGHRVGDVPPEFRFVAGRDWEENSLAEATITMSAFNDMIRFTSRQADSDYSASSDYLRRLTLQDNDKSRLGKDRFLGHDPGHGSANLQRLEATLWKSDDFGLDVFTERSSVDKYFEGLYSKQHSKDDPFASPDRNKSKVGSTFRVGSLSLSISQAYSESADHPSEQQGTEQNATASLDFATFRQQHGDVFGGRLWALAPDSVWVSMGRGQLEPRHSGSDLSDATDDLSYGASWNWTSGYAGLDYWHSSYDDRQPGAKQYDWYGDGLDANAGLYGGQWNLDLSLSTSRSTSLGSGAASVDKGYDASASFTYRPEHLPDISVIADLGWYASEAPTYGDSYRYWSLSTVFDLSKLIKPADTGTGRRLEVLLRYSGNSDVSSYSRSDVRNDAVMAFVYRIGL